MEVAVLERAATERLAEFVVGVSFDGFSSELVAAAVRPVIDSVGVMHAGRTADAGEVILRYGERVAASGAGCVRVVGSSWVVPAEVAALMNGTLGHSLDFDDSLGGVGHPSVSVLSALLATALPEPLTGSALLEAYITGYEVAARLGKAFGPQHYKKGWHTTATNGTFAATAAVAKLVGLGVEQLLVAFGIAASMAAGLQRNFGTMTKPLHSGLAARNGVLAVELARLGFTAATDVLDRPKGFLDLYCLGASRLELLERLGEPYSLIERGPTLKKYPCCFETHRAIDAVLQLQAAHGFAPDDVDEIICTAPTDGLGPLLYRIPETDLEARFSMEYNIAAALIDRRIDLDSFAETAIHRPEIRSLIERISVSEDPRCRPEDPENLYGSAGTGGFVEVVVRARGSEALAQVHQPAGAPEQPLSRQELETKFLDCVRAGGYDADAGADVLDGLRRLQDQQDVHALLARLAPPGIAVPRGHATSKEG